MSNKAILLGGGGHARVVAELAMLNNFNIIGVIDPKYVKQAQWDYAINCFENEEVIMNFSTEELSLLNGIGSIPGSESMRRIIFKKFYAQGFKFPSLIHPQAVISKTAHIDQGVQLMAGVIVNAKSSIGLNTLINTGAIIEHDCIIQDHVHIAPRAVLCGGVVLNKNVHIGAGAIILQNVSIGENSIIGAGAVVRHSIPGNQVVYSALMRVKTKSLN